MLECISRWLASLMFETSSPADNGIQRPCIVAYQASGVGATV